MISNSFDIVGQRLQQIVAVCIALLLIAGCAATPMQIPAEPDAIFSNVKRGDLVNIATKDGHRLRFYVEKISQTRLSGGGYMVPYDLISEIVIETKGESKALMALPTIFGAIGLILLLVGLAL